MEAFVIALILGFFLVLVLVHAARARRLRRGHTEAEAAHAWHSQQRRTDARRRGGG